MTKMKLNVMSDLHVEFEPFEAKDTDADVVILAGDIGPKLRGFDVARTQFGDKPVVYVAGNHEYYGTAYPHLTRKLAERTSGTNVHFLELGEVVIQDVRFLGCTLWTDFDLFGRDNRDFCRWEAEAKLSDYRKIRRSPQFRKLKPYDTSAIHFESISWLKQRLSTPFEGKTVVVSHHAPARGSVMPRYADDYLSAAYVSDLESWLSEQSVDLWIHGHTHQFVDYRVGNTRIVCNPKGYRDERVEDFDAAFTVEV